MGSLSNPREPQIYTLKGINPLKVLHLHPKGYKMPDSVLSIFIKEKRRGLRLTQPQLAIKAGVGLRFIRELEGGKESLRMDKVNQVLKLFGHELGPILLNRTSLTDAQS